MLKAELNKQIEYWKSMPRNNMHELMEADKFFDEILMPLSKKLFLKEQKGFVPNKYYGMMLTLGTSWQPLALSIALLEPAKVLILCTDDTAVLVDKLKKFLKLPEDLYEVVLVDRSESQDVYKAMRDFYNRYRCFGDICADITGGTKAMASSAAVMASVLGLDIYYVESKYLPLYRRPEPGSEKIKKLSDPRKC